MIFRVFINPKIATELLLSSKKTIERQRKSTVDYKRLLACLLAFACFN